MRLSLKARGGFEIVWEERKLTPDRHRKNNSRRRDPRRRLRIYFAWDEITRMVAIDRLAGHIWT